VLSLIAGEADVAGGRMIEPVVIPDLLRERVAAEPNRIALLVDGGRPMSYAEWDRRSNAAARGLTELGIAPGDRLGLFFENAEWTEYAVAYMAAVKAGAVAVPLSSRFTRDDLRSLLERCGAVGLVRGTHQVTGPGWTTSLADLERGRSAEPFQVRAAPEDVAEILYTSGTTGVPQGVACRHEHVVRPLVHGGGWPPPWWCSGRTYLHANAVSTAGGQLRLLEPLGPQRMTTVALPVFHPNRFCELAQLHRAAVVQLVPAMAASIIETGAFRDHDLSSVQIVSLGCAPLPPSLVPKLAAAFPSARLVNMYELTEARHAGTTFVHQPLRDGARSGSVGRPRGATQVRVTDERGKDVPRGVVGEVRLRWPGLPPQHYYRDARATARVFVDGWTRTGDSGYLDEDGYLYLVDRIKDVIIKGGVNIGSVEIENALREHPAISDCAVVGVPDPLHGEEVAAALVVRRPVSPYELRKFLAARLAPHKVPQRFLELAMLPRNRSGKVLKRELQARLAAETRPAQASPPFPVPPAERLRPTGEPGVPLANGAHPGPPLQVPEHLVPVLEQLVQGDTDLTASRRLKVSPRTFSRRVAELLDHLQVRTRFQCGVEIVARGWVPSPPEQREKPQAAGQNSP
jgi:acyl-CoA synthetase (AMP-forming)/AMP-acid ligase II